MEGFEYEGNIESMIVSSKSKCESFIQKIKETGFIDTNEWEKYEPQERDLESEWRNDAVQEQMERTGRY